MWKRSKCVHRVSVQGYDDDEPLTITIDMLPHEVTPDNMDDFFTFFAWYFDDNYDIIKVEDVEIWSWKEFRGVVPWRGFHRDFGDGERLSISHITL